MMYATEVATSLGLKRYTRSWRGPCPVCDYSRTFSVRAGRDGRALLFCASCQDRDALADAVARAIGRERPPDRRDGGDAIAARQRKQDAALALWSGSEPPAGTLADCYLTGRGPPLLGNLRPCSAFAALCDMPHPEGGRLPALVALVTDVAGRPLGIHRTYLAHDGSKARVEPSKASLGPVWGGADPAAPACDSQAHWFACRRRRSKAVPAQAV